MSSAWTYCKELSFKLSGVGQRERSDIQVKCSQQTQPAVIGKANEVSLTVNNKVVTALLDTGSMVSTISASLCAELQMSIQTLDEVFCVKGAGGHDIPYLGVVEVRIGCQNLQVDGFPALMLVMPDTQYHSRVPVLLGTNVLNAMKDQVTVKDFVWKNTFAILAKHQALVNRQDSLGRLVTTKPQTIPANGRVRILGQTRVKAICQRLTVCLDGSNALPRGVIATPCVGSISPGRARTKLPVELVNHLSQDVTIPAKVQICDLYSTEDVDRMEDEFSAKLSAESEADASFLKNFSYLKDELDKDRVEAMKSLLLKWKSAFSTHDLDLGLTDKVTHRIRLKDDMPFKERPRPIPPSMFEEVRAHLKEMETLGVIRRSQSPYASNVVIVRKKNGALRFCLDMRILNTKTIRDSYSLPRIDSTLNVLSGSKWFSVLDLKSGYWQVPLAEEDKCKTAFTVGPLGFWECERMPFGLTNAPATFQRLMENCMGDLHLSYCLLYLDDIIVFSSSYEEHLVRLEAIFAKLKDARLKLSPSKCHFLCKEIKYLGHMISEKGIGVDPEKISCVKDWPVPKSVKQVQGFLGFTSFYRRFIRDFAKIAKPLHEVTQGGEHVKLKTKNAVRYPPLKWGESQQQAFEKLKDACCETPILGFADYSRPFTLHTDASGDGLGGVLSQQQDGSSRVIAYASRSLSKSERNYPAHKLEFLALKWAVTEKFHEYLYGNTFAVVTDNNPLTYVLKNAKLDATGHRWVAQLANYDFSISYAPGSTNHVADALSRIQWPQVTSEVISQLLQVHLDQVTPVDSFCYDHHAIPDDLNWELEFDQSINWAVEQDLDLDIQAVKNILSRKLTKGDLSPDAAKLLRERKNLVLIDNKLIRKRNCSGEIQYQLIVPNKYREVALKFVHDKMGHLGRDRTLELLRERYYWPGMQQAVVNYITKCGRCLRRKDLYPQRAMLVNTETTQPMKLVCTDFLKLEKSKGGIENVLVVTDHFTKYAQAYPTTNQTARTTAKALFERFFVHYGFPSRIHSDQGRNFESKLIEELCQLTGTQKSRTTPYHPMGNGIAERFNSTLINMLGTLEPHQKMDWKSHVGAMVHAYNCTRHDITGYSPYFLMFGRHPRIAVDVVLGRYKSDCGSDYVGRLKEQLSKAYEIAERNSRNSQGNQKKFYDRRIRGAVLEPGDRVLVRKVGLKGMQKLADRWSEEVYIVVGQPNSDIPVYRVKLEVGRGAVKTLHRNLLLPLCSLPIVKKPVPRARSITPIEPVILEDSESSGSDDDALSEGESMVFVGKSEQRKSSVTSISVDGLVNVSDLESIMDGTVSRSVIDDDLELQVPSLGTDEVSINITQGDSSHDVSVTSEIGDSNFPVDSDSTGISGNSSEESGVSAIDTEMSGVNNGSVEQNETNFSADTSSVSESVQDKTPPIPAPRRSSRIRNQGHLRSDFVYDFSQVTREHEPESNLQLEKISLLKDMIAVLK